MLRYKLRRKSQSEIYWPFIEVVLVSIILISFLWYVNSIKTNTLSQKQFLSRDIALLTNTIYSSPGNLYYWYEPYPSLGIILNKFDYSLKDQKAIIKEQNLETRYPYGENTLMAKDSSLLQSPLKLEFENSGNSFIFKNNIQANYIKLKYPYLDTKSDLKSKKIVFVSGITKSPVTGAEYIEGESYTSLITPILGASAESKISLKLEEADINTGMKIIGQEKGDIIVGVKTDILEENSIKIYISYPKIKESRKLASLIANELSEKENVRKTIDIIPLIPIETTEANNAILLSLGRSTTKSLQNDIISSIAGGIKGYYS